MKYYLLPFCICLLFYYSPINAQENISYDLGEYTVYYNVFNSSLIPAEVAQAYHLTRAKDRVYLNVAVVKKSGGYGFAPAKLEGVYRNLIQQQFPLKFIEIKESTSTYYLAPIHFNNEDILHLDITVKPNRTGSETTFTITKKLYVDQ
ncbi:hypothetical protein AB835_03020 [Candidatus Endobugula sertula]|uniref:DUF4426 domain-containing protein n=1 Tax=Candidatus Endobugula sertula TaxID=62101 RepID=A0A1D2QSK1_9GAMM|nr:hypothetical protein AB835_03020 [Candidatus Endobugula sertula]